MPNGLGSHIFPDPGTSFRNSASAPFQARSLETPDKIKFTCPVSEARYFNVTKDESVWGSQAYGVEALDQKTFDNLPLDDSRLIYTTNRAARMMADTLNAHFTRMTSEDTHRSNTLQTSITVPPAINQSIKL